MFKYLLILSLFTITKNCDAFIVPQEIPSLLSLIYSNIPPIKKGTDSRVGFGYRLGDHADFQVQFEIGPQKETQAIGNANSSNRRRSVTPVEREITKQEKKKEESLEKTKTNDSSWLQTWHRGMTQNVGTKKSRAPNISLANERIPKISKDKLNQLLKLYDSARKFDNDSNDAGKESLSDVEINDEEKEGN